MGIRNFTEGTGAHHRHTQIMESRAWRLAHADSNHTIHRSTFQGKHSMSRSIASRRQRRRRPPVARTLFVLFACTFMVLANLSTTPASAADAATPAADFPGEAIPEEELADTESEMQETLLMDEESDETFDLSIAKWDCNDPVTAPYGSATLADYQAACPNPMSAQFEAANDYGYYEVQVGSNVHFTPPTEFTMVSELLPDGYGAPAIFCDVGSGMEFQNDTNSSVVLIGKNDDSIDCAFYNMVLPGEDEESGETLPDDPYADLVVHTFECPVGYDVTDMGADPAVDCTVPMDGVTFTLDHPDPAETDLQTMTGDSIPGAVSFGSVMPAVYTLLETPPAGIESAFLWDCTNNGQLMPGMAPLSTGFSAPMQLEAGDDLDCRWYNVPEDDEPTVTPTPDPMPVDLIIEKYTCPAGYDAWGAMADPLTDCTAGPNGINFTLTDTDPATVDLMTMTGDSIDNAVMFGGLEPDSYTVTEDVPAGIAEVFVLDCVGAMDGMVRPVPFSTGNVLTLDITGYEGEIVCLWFNVPADPHGSITVIKYACTTEHFVSDVDCQVLETGQGFDLLWWDGSDWVAITYGITDGHGRLRFTDLDEGQWWLEEHNQTWCHIASDDLSPDGTWLDVTAGEETVVEVYNCGYEPTWETPTTYPNTGIQPTRQD